MKSAPVLSILALACSVIALVISLTRPAARPSQQEIGKMVDVALARKEMTYVQSLAPKMDRIYKDLLGPKYTSPKKTPETFGELLGPAFNIVTQATTGNK
jgi:hypothetical protein